MHDGSLLAPARGQPPPAPAGYVQSRGNPYMFLPSLAVCEHRVLKEKKSSCCGDRTLEYCNLKNKHTTYLMCQECKHMVLEGKKLYEALYADSKINYGSAKHNRCPGVRYIPKYFKHLISPVVDLGCGSGDTVAALKQQGFVVQGMDWIDHGLDHIVHDITVRTDLSLYYTAICIDVLEHITDDKLAGLFENLKQVQHQVVTVYCGSSKEHGYEQELHTNIKTPSSWVELLSQHFIIMETIRLASVRYLYLMRHKHGQ